MKKISFWIACFIILTACSTTKDWSKSPVTINEGIHDIAIISEDDAIAYSYGTGSISKTTDGGKNWHKQYQFDSIYFEQIQFLDAQNGWIIGSPNKIFKTEDGGTTWIDKSLKEAPNVYIYGMHFDTKNHGFIAAFQYVNKKAYTKIMATYNGGNSWELVHQLEEVILHLERIDNILYGTGNNVVIKNIDVKDSWDYCYKDAQKKVGQIRDLAKNKDKILAASFNGYIIDLQQPSVKINKITNNRIRSLAAVKKQHWIAVGDTNKESGNVFISKDNGQNWNISKDTFPDIHRLKKSKKRLWAVGKEGLIMSRRQ